MGRREGDGLLRSSKLYRHPPSRHILVSPSVSSPYGSAPKGPPEGDEKRSDTMPYDQGLTGPKRFMSQENYHPAPVTGLRPEGTR